MDRNGGAPRTSHPTNGALLCFGLRLINVICGYVLGVTTPPFGHHSTEGNLSAGFAASSVNRRRGELCSPEGLHNIRRFLVGQGLCSCPPLRRCCVVGFTTAPKFPSVEGCPKGGVVPNVTLASPQGVPIVTKQIPISFNIKKVV